MSWLQVIQETVTFNWLSLHMRPPFKANSFPSDKKYKLFKEEILFICKSSAKCCYTIIQVCKFLWSSWTYHTGNCLFTTLSWGRLQTPKAAEQLTPVDTSTDEQELDLVMFLIQICRESNFYLRFYGCEWGRKCVFLCTAFEGFIRVSLCFAQWK